MDRTYGQQEKKKAYAAPVLAILSAVGSLACCLPFEVLAAFGAASAGAVFATLRPWLLAVSAVFLAIGFVQLYRGGKSCHRRSVTNIAVFWIAVVVFLAMLFFPQQVASLLAGHFAL
jgi:hypothetical protein